MAASSAGAAGSAAGPAPAAAPVPAAGRWTRPGEANVLVTAVGGQGGMLAAEVLALVAAASGKQVKQTEVHGVAQRGGAVVSHVRYGPAVRSPVIPRGKADLILGFEKLETIRVAHWLRPGGVIVADERELRPMAMDQTQYPARALEFLREKGFVAVAVPAYEKAVEIGTPKVASMVLLGAASYFLDLPLEAWERVIAERVPQRFLDANRRAYAAGRELAAEAVAAAAR